jgi:formylmethanofuran dehydrogenase subunit E
MKKQFYAVFCTLIFLALVGAANAQQTAARSNEATKATKEAIIKQIAEIHGGTGPFAVAGYRIGQRALMELKLPKGSFEIDVEHNSLPQVRWSCIADGIQAATGASVGKMNLRLNLINDSKEVRSIVSNKKTGAKIIFRLTDAFLQKYLDTPHEQINDAGRTVLDLKDADIFAMQIVSAGQSVTTENH